MSDLTPATPPPDVAPPPTHAVIRLAAWGLVALAVALMLGGFLRSEIDTYLTGSGDDGGWIFLGLVLAALLVPLALWGFVLRCHTSPAPSAGRQFLVELSVLVPFALMCLAFAASFVVGGLAVMFLLELLIWLGLPIGGEGLGVIGLAEWGGFFGGVAGASICLWWFLRRSRK